jgi:hypothetical protein
MQVILSSFNLNSPNNDKELFEKTVANDLDCDASCNHLCQYLGIFHISIVGGRNIQLINLNIGVQDVLATM